MANDRFGVPVNHQYTVKFENNEDFTTVEFGKVYAEDVHAARMKAATYLHMPHQWECIAIERND